MALSIASIGGIGFIPGGPATAGTVVGATVFYALRPRPAHRIALAAGAAIAGQACVMRLGADSGHDPQYVVIDEVAGVWFALTATHASGPNCLIGAILFRLLDRLKPGPIGVVDARGGVWGVMGDDLVAGAVTALLMHLGARISESLR